MASKNLEQIYKTIKAPVITEKTSLLAQNGNINCFKVSTDATKKSVKQAVEEIFKVDVVSVKITNLKGKVKSFGRKRIIGKRNDSKKAYVRIKEGQSIEEISGV